MSEPMVQVRKITMNFKGLRALNDVGFDVDKGSITGIIGPNGAGKTTMFNILTGKFKPTAGQITFDGKDITGISSNNICRLGISRTYQSDRPFHALSILNNVKIAMLYGRGEGPPPKALWEKELIKILDFVQLGNIADKKAEELTPLERKRLEIGRALATNPRLLLLDEIVAGLTPSETLEMMETIRAINKLGITVLLIEHVMKAVMGLSDKIIVLHHGEKIAEGNPTQVSQNEEVIGAYLGTSPG